MSLDQSYPFPQVFLVNGGGSSQSSGQPPALVPCWPFPPAPQRVRGREKSRGCMGISHSLAMIVLLLFLLVFAALGFEAYQIYKMQTELKQIRQDNPETDLSTPQKQIGFSEPEVHRDDNREDNRPAAHVIGRIEKVERPLSQTLRWELRTSRSFVSGGVTYHFEDGGLQVNESGLYHIYSRVELILKSCSPSSFTHSVFVRREGHLRPLNLMEAHRAGFCSRELQHSWTTESYLGSALKLQKYDKVYVNVSQALYLSHEHYANFFGLYKV